MKLKYLILGLSIFFLSISCKKKMDDVFEEKQNVRLDASVASAYSALQSSKDGWIMKYFPGIDREYGGYTFFVKFTNATDVLSETEFLAGIQASNYRVYPGAGPILTFDTFDLGLHFLSLPGAYTGIGPNDSGAKGDFEFLVTKASPDGIELEGRKTYNKIVLVPIKPSEASTIVADYEDAYAKYDPFEEYQIEVGTEIFPAFFGDDLLKRALITLDGSEYFSYRYIPEGFEFYKEYEFKGVKFKILKYVEPTGNYPLGYFSNDAGTIKLVPTT